MIDYSDFQEISFLLIDERYKAYDKKDKELILKIEKIEKLLSEIADEPRNLKLIAEL